MISRSTWQALPVAGGLLLSSLSVFTSPVSAQTLQFGTHKDYATGYGPGSIAVGDLNGDGRADLAVADAFSDLAAVLFGNADGSFQPPTLIYLGPSNNPRSIAIGDVNRDGKPDLVVANALANTVAVARDAGDGCRSSSAHQRF